jgi:Werner syndrome ATP-dependent helicase
MVDYTSVLTKVFKFSSFRDNQLKIIKAVLNDKRDVNATMFTGAGKSLCYQFPPVYLNKVSIIISPLISLMNDQTIKMNKLGIPTCSINSTISGIQKIKKDILKNKYRLVYTTPESMIKCESYLRELSKTGLLVMIAIDESHCTSMWGHDFRTSYMGLSCLKEWVPDTPIIALTATATEEVQADIIQTLNLDDPLIVRTTFDRPNLYMRVLPKSVNALTDILHLVADNCPSIIYCQTRKETEKIANELKENGVSCDAYHAGLSDLERELVHESFIENEIKCVVATIAFGMGIDKVVRKVIHYGMPKDVESYYQEIGRAGRDGKKSRCYLYYSLGDLNLTGYFLRKIEDVSYREYKRGLVKLMKQYVYSTKCRRKFILKYFGETYEKENCQNCDNCLKKNKFVKYNVTTEAILMIHAMFETGNIFGSTMIVNILRGSKAKTIPHKFKKLRVYGEGINKSAKWWKVFSKVLIDMSFVKEIHNEDSFGSSLMATLDAKKWLINISGPNKISPKPEYENKLLINLPAGLLDNKK